MQFFAAGAKFMLSEQHTVQKK